MYTGGVGVVVVVVDVVAMVTDGLHRVVASYRCC
jgi:hypothetical protein